MNIVEMLNHIGVENTECQWLHQSFTGGRTMKHECVLTFAAALHNGMSAITDAATGDKTRMALIIWFDADRLPEELK